MEEIQKKMSAFNQITSDYDYPVISSLEWCQKVRKPERNFKTRQKWYQKYSVPETYAKDVGPEKPKEKECSFQAGDTISAIEAVNHSQGEFGKAIGTCAE